MKRLLISVIFTLLNLASVSAKETQQQDTPDCFFSLEAILSGTFDEENLTEIIYTNSSFNEGHLGFKDQCKEEAKRYPKNIRLDCETISQFNRFLEAKKDKISAAAVYSAINEIDMHKEFSDKHKSCKQKIDEKLEGAQCNSLSQTFDEIKNTTFMGEPLFKAEEEGKETVSISPSTIQALQRQVARPPLTQTPLVPRVPGPMLAPAYFQINENELRSCERSSQRDEDDSCIATQAVRSGVEQTRTRKVIEFTKEAKELCSPVLTRIETLCENKLGSKPPLLTDSEDFRKFLTSEFMEFHKENLSEDDSNILAQSILYSFNYYTCAQENFKEPLFDSNENHIEPTEKAFLQSQCNTKGKSKAEYAIAKSNFFSSTYSNISLSDDELKKIEQETKEYLESDEGRKAVAQAYRDAGLDVPKRYSSDANNSSTEKVAQNNPINNNIDNNIYNKPSDSLLPTESNIGTGGTPIDQGREINEAINKNNKKIQSAEQKAKKLEDQFATNFSNNIPVNDPKNQDIIKQLKALQEEMKRLRAENKRLAESQSTSKSTSSSSVAETNNSGTSSQAKSGSDQKESSSPSSSSSFNSGTKTATRSTGASASTGISRSGSQGSVYRGGGQVPQGVSIGSELGQSDFDSQYKDYRQEVLGGPYPDYNDLSFVMVIDDTDAENPVTIVYKVLKKPNSKGEKITVYEQIAMGDALALMSSLELKEGSAKRDIASEQKTEESKIKPKEEEKGLIDSLLNTLNLD